LLTVLIWIPTVQVRGWIYMGQRLVVCACK
jgi:hypothetical protein